MPDRSIVKYILILSILLMLSSSAFAMLVKCSNCGRGIKGEYILYDDKFFHKSCYEQVAPRCVSCNEILEGEYVYADAKAYHKYCYLDNIALRCVICSELIEGNYMEHEGGKYHQHCYLENVALKCDICSEAIDGPYIVNFWNDKYHSSHDNEYPRCDYCQRLIAKTTTGGGITYNDGRNICNSCYKTAVFSNVKAQKIFEEIRSVLHGKGISVDITDVPLYVVDRAELADKSNDTNPKELGFTACDEASMNGEIISRRNSIYILAGLPELIFRGVLAHEMMHVWINVNTEHNQKPPLSEGAANYASYLIYSNQEGKYAEFLLDVLDKDKDRIYGDGYRKVKNYVRQNGLFAFLKYLKYYKELP